MYVLLLVTLIVHSLLVVDTFYTQHIFTSSIILTPGFYFTPADSVVKGKLMDLRENIITSNK